MYLYTMDMCLNQINNHNNNTHNYNDQIPMQTDYKHHLMKIQIQ